MRPELLLSIIAMIGWLVLAAGAFRAHRVGARQAVVMALMWGAVFMAAAAVFGAFA